MLNNLSPTLLTKLIVKFNYTLSADLNSSTSLFYLSTASKQYMNLKIVDNVVQFEWKLGVNINTLEYSLLQSDFYTIRIDRFVLNALNNRSLSDQNINLQNWRICRDGC